MITNAPWTQVRRYLPHFPPALVWTFALLFALAATPEAALPADSKDSKLAQAHDRQVVFVVRHAEKADDGTKDPPLSEAGRRRAAALAQMLQDASISAVFSSPYERTKQTVKPLAEALSLTTTILGAADFKAIVAAIDALPSDARAVISGHSNTVPAILKALGAKEQDLPTLSDDDYGDLFIITRATDPPGILRLRF